MLQYLYEAGLHERGLIVCTQPRKVAASSLATRVAQDATFMDEVFAFCQILLKRAPLAMGMAKHIINTCQNVDTETGRILERLGQSILIGTADNHEGMTAFREKRPPKFTNS